MLDDADNSTSSHHALLAVTGISGRSTADMLLRMGLNCHVIDQFADFDTGMICERRISRLDSLRDLLDYEDEIAASSGVIFAGGLEGLVTAPELLKNVNDCSRRLHTEFGSLRTLTDRRELNRLLKESGVSNFLFREVTDRFQTDFIVKDLTRSGSARRFTAGEFLDLKKLGPHVVAQELILGDSISAIFVADHADRSAPTIRCIGVTQQLFGQPFSNRLLTWCGSTTGYSLTRLHHDQLLKIGRTIGYGARIEGVFGIDFIVNPSGVWPVDVNPRIPASAELFGADAVAAHLAAFDFNAPCRSAHNDQTLPNLIRGKAVVFNLQPNPFVFSEAHFRSVTQNLPFRHCSDLDSQSIADVPVVDTSIQSGHPILTAFASASTKDDLLEQLAAIAAMVRQETAT